jgi:hypothetical protein
LEARIGRTLTKCDFANALVNDLQDGSFRSERLLNRMTATEGHAFDGTDSLVKFLTGDIFYRSQAREFWRKAQTVALSGAVRQTTEEHDRKERKRFFCVDCGIDTIEEWSATSFGR